VSEETQILEPSNFPLWGSRLIEASAGTGKTYTIAALYVRLILGHGQDNGPPCPLSPREILVMTFTKAATQELTTRIQQRLTQAAQIFRGQLSIDPGDKFLIELLHDYPTQASRDNAAWLLNEAAQFMDEACIYTIDAWCQRVLKEYAVYSGQPFDEELVSNQEQLRQQALEDFWRQSVYPLTPDNASLLKSIWPREIDGLQNLIDDHAFELEDISDDEEEIEKNQIFDLNEYLTEMLNARALKLGEIKRDALVCLESIQPWIDSLSNKNVQVWNLRKLVKSSLLKWIVAIEDWCRDDKRLEVDLDAKHWKRLSWGEIRLSLLDQQADISYPKELDNFEKIGSHLFSLPTLKKEIENYCLSAVKSKIKFIKKQNSTFGFSDLLMRLNSRLHQKNSEVLKGLIKKQYPVILIDEFQDTSALQYSIFNTIYEINKNNKNNLICLIADPKQSIYAFRGADIKSYMLAKESTKPRHYYLDRNFRSTTGLVQAVNRWFNFAQTHAPWGAFLYKTGEDDDLPFLPVKAKGLNQQIVQTQNLTIATMPSISMVCDLVPKNAESIRKKFASLCAEKIVGWLNDNEMSYAQEENLLSPENKQRIKPADIAILVRTTKESIAVRHALSLRGVASVFLSDKDSVFATHEARDLIYWLDAVANPRNADKVRAGLATSTMAFEIEEIKSIGQDENMFDHYSEIVIDLHRVWQQFGVLAMLRGTLFQFSLPKKWLKKPEGERKLTNFLHLSELLQAESLNQPEMQNLVNWLESSMHEKNFQTDEHILRLESDAALVKVITIHKSKGLEFPVVCIPFPTLFNTKSTQKEKKKPFEDDSLSDLNVVDEELRESMRLFYVALTRAKYSLWIGFALFKGRNANKDITHRSALGYLVGCCATQLEPIEWKNKINYFFQDVSDSRFEEYLFLQGSFDEHQSVENGTRDSLFAVNSVEEFESFNIVQVKSSASALRPPVHYSSNFERDFKIQSFTSLLRSAESTKLALTAIVDDIANHDEFQAWEDGVNHYEDDIKRVADVSHKPLVIERQNEQIKTLPSWRKLPGGMRMGTFIHNTLQWLIQEGLQAFGTDTMQLKLTQKIEISLPLVLAPSRTVTFGSSSLKEGSEFNDEYVEAFSAWFNSIVDTIILPLGISLKQLTNHLCEMEFWLSVEYFQAQRVDQLCRSHLFPHLERPQLTPHNWHGLMMGFSDLLFEHEGKFWLMDYKSNYLGIEDDSYSKDNIDCDVVKHRYDLQMAIYMVALHRFLKSRLGPNYSVQERLGGAIIWYLRGVDSPGQGICLIPCTKDMIESLDCIVSGLSSSQNINANLQSNDAVISHD